MFNEIKSVDIYLDFQKAFHKVPHKRLLGKVSTHGILRNIPLWIVDGGLAHSVETVSSSEWYLICLARCQKRRTGSISAWFPGIPELS